MRMISAGVEGPGRQHRTLVTVGSSEAWDHEFPSANHFGRSLPDHNGFSLLRLGLGELLA